MQRIGEFCPQDLSITAWSFAKVLYDGRRPLMEHIAGESLPRLQEFTGRNLANLAWAFATAAHRDLDLCEALVRSCEERLRDLKAQELPITLWSFAAISYPADDLFHAAADQVMRTVDGMDMSHVCNVAWAFARTSLRNEPLFDVLANAALHRLDAVETLHIANLAWAFANVSRADELDMNPARVGIRHERLFNGIAAAAAHQTHNLLPQHCTSLLWAFGACTVPCSREMLDAIQVAARRDENQYTPRHVAGMLWSLAVHTQRHEPLCSSLISKATAEGIRGLASDGPAHLASIVWAAARLECGAHPGLQHSLCADVDTLLGALAGNAAEISDGRQQNIASVVRAMYSIGLNDTARLLFSRAMEFAVPVGAEAWAAWICGAQGEADARFENSIWLELAASCGEGPQRTSALVAAAVRACAADQPQLAEFTLRQIGEGAHISGHLVARLGCRLQLPPASQGSPRGEYRRELHVAKSLKESAPSGDASPLLQAAEDLPVSVSQNLISLGGGARAAALDAAIDVAVNGRMPGDCSQFVVLDLGCGIGSGAIRAWLQSKERLRGASVRVIACECDSMRAAVALGLIDWAGLSKDVEVLIGQGEQLLPRLRQLHGAGFVDVLLLRPQGAEYGEELETAENLGLLKDTAVVLAEDVLRPLAPQLLWRICSGGAYEQVMAISCEAEWVLVAKRRGDAALRARGSAPAPQSVAQLQYCSDEARRRSLAWQSRNRLEMPRPLLPDEAEAARASYETVGIAPRVVYPTRVLGGWRVDIASAG
eukprot:TRINITY_DN29177_c0_g1_i3.p1 TRINITY_DN29177_c0_g1~~TRINITY_DN29177_c0_g1_i3.p1  ORF type:complete len:772 (+),score=109.38 TRINITY_DN29177_c0_g1_i3:368-2683(+)